MRTDEEFKNEVFARMDRKSRETRSGKKRILILAVAAAVGAVALAITGIALFSGPKDSPQDFSFGGEVSSDTGLQPSEPSEEPVDAALYRPAGYSANIGTVLALKMEFLETSEEPLSVLLSAENPEDSVTEIIDDTNKYLSDKIDLSKVKLVRVDSADGSETEKTYMSNLTRSQIFALAENGIGLLYIGSGTASSNEVGFDTPKGIDNYCELNGDNLLISSVRSDFLGDQSVPPVSQPAEDPAASNVEPTIDQPYEYPVLPGTDAWKLLRNVEEKRAACAVPLEQLKAMTTKALTETVCRYPLFADVYAYGNTKAGLNALSGYFDGVEVLKTRSDALACLREFAAEEPERTETTEICYFNADLLIDEFSSKSAE